MPRGRKRKASTSASTSASTAALGESAAEKKASKEPPTNQSTCLTQNSEGKFVPRFSKKQKQETTPPQVPQPPPPPEEQVKSEELEEPEMTAEVTMEAMLPPPSKGEERSEVGAAQSVQPPSIDYLHKEENDTTSHSEPVVDTCITSHELKEGSGNLHPKIETEEGRSQGSKNDSELVEMEEEERVDVHNRGMEGNGKPNESKNEAVAKMEQSKSPPLYKEGTMNEDISKDIVKDAADSVPSANKTSSVNPSIMHNDEISHDLRDASDAMTTPIINDEYSSIEAMQCIYSTTCIVTEETTSGARENSNVATNNDDLHLGTAPLVSNASIECMDLDVDDAAADKRSSITEDSNTAAISSEQGAHAISLINELAVKIPDNTASDITDSTTAEDLATSDAKSSTISEPSSGELADPNLTTDSVITSNHDITDNHPVKDPVTACTNIEDLPNITEGTPALIEAPVTTLVTGEGGIGEVAVQRLDDSLTFDDIEDFMCDSLDFSEESKILQHSHDAMKNSEKDRNIMSSLPYTVPSAKPFGHKEPIISVHQQDFRKSLPRTLYTPIQKPLGFTRMQTLSPAHLPLADVGRSNELMTAQVPSISPCKPTPQGNLELSDNSKLLKDLVTEMTKLNQYVQKCRQDLEVAKKQRASWLKLQRNRTCRQMQQQQQHQY